MLPSLDPILIKGGIYAFKACLFSFALQTTRYIHICWFWEVMWIYSYIYILYILKYKDGADLIGKEGILYLFCKPPIHINRASLIKNVFFCGRGDSGNTRKKTFFLSEMLPTVETHMNGAYAGAEKECKYVHIKMVEI